MMCYACGVQGMSLTKGMLFGKYAIAHNEDKLCVGIDHKYVRCHCTFTISVGLPDNAGRLCWMWHNNPEWRKCVSLEEWLAGMIKPEDCGPAAREDDFAGKQEWIEVIS